MTFVDLFCGVGGVRLGMEQAGFDCLAASEIDTECRKTYLANFSETPLGDIRQINAEQIPKHDVLCAGFPCQPFSISGKKRGFSDTRGTLFFELLRILEAKRPPVVFLENVKHLVYHDSGNTLAVILAELETLGYTVSWRVLNAVDFGIPQNRERIIIIGSLTDKFNFDRVKKQPRKCLADFLNTSGDFDYLSPQEYTLLETPKQQQVPGLIFAGYRNKPIRKVGILPNTEHLSRAHKQPNRIYSVYGSHPTLSSQETSGRYFILTGDNKVRKLTLNECWRLMGFPESFIRVSSVSSQYKQLGNSVCVPMIKVLAEEIRAQFFSSKPI